MKMKEEKPFRKKDKQNSEYFLRNFHFSVKKPDFRLRNAGKHRKANAKEWRSNWHVLADRQEEANGRLRKKHYGIN